MPGPLSYCDARQLATAECMRDDPSVFCYGIEFPITRRYSGLQMVS